MHFDIKIFTFLDVCNKIPIHFAHYELDMNFNFSDTEKHKYLLIVCTLRNRRNREKMFSRNFTPKLFQFAISSFCDNKKNERECVVISNVQL